MYILDSVCILVDIFINTRNKRISQNFPLSFPDNKNTNFVFVFAGGFLLFTMIALNLFVYV